SAEEASIEEVNQKLRELRDRESSAKAQITTEQATYVAQVKDFEGCLPVDFTQITMASPMTPPDDFGVCVDEYVKIQKEMHEFSSGIQSSLQRLEMALGPDYAGADEVETITRFREELEALPEREEVLSRAWQHQLAGLEATFDQILRALGDIRSAADRLNRDFSGIQVSNLASLKMEVLEHSDVVGSMRRLAKIEQPGLFDDSTGLEATIASFRSRFEASPILRYQDLFTLRFTVT